MRVFSQSLWVRWFQTFKLAGWVYALSTRFSAQCDTSFAYSDLHCCTEEQNYKHLRYFNTLKIEFAKEKMLFLTCY